MPQRQPRLGDILDDYCPRERRVTNHAVVAMVADQVKQTRCTTCDAEHEYKHARVPRQRRAETPPAYQAQVRASAPKRVVPDTPTPAPVDATPLVLEVEVPAPVPESARETPAPLHAEHHERAESEGPAHRRLIRATLPRQEGQAAPSRPAPEFTIRQPAGGRPNRFRPRHQRAAGTFQGNRSAPPGGGLSRGGPTRHDSRPHGGHGARSGNRGHGGPGGASGQGGPGGPGGRHARRHDSGRKRFK